MFFLSVTSINAASYYVATNGNDLNNGSLTSPLKTISKALNISSPGDFIYLRAGTYPAFTITKSGTIGNYITISSYNGEKAIVSGGYDAINLRGVSYIKIYGLEITAANGQWGAGIHSRAYNGAFPDYNIFENNIIHDNIGYHTLGILVENGSYNKIINNKVYNNYYSGIALVGHPSTRSSSTGNEIIGNEVYGNLANGSLTDAGNTDGIKTEGGSMKNSLIQSNTVYNNGDDGIDTWNTTGNTIVGNISRDNVGPGDGNGFKLGGFTSENGISYFGGGNTIKDNIAYGNKYNGFESNGSGANYYEGNIAYNNGFALTSKNAWGIQDSWRTNNDNRPSSIVKNNAFNNKTANYAKGQYTTTFTNNTEDPNKTTPGTSPTPTPNKQGDANGDGKVDEADYSIWFDNYNQNVSGVANGNFNGDNKVDGIDYVIWLTNYGR